jgi:hypothetical protein
MPLDVTVYPKGYSVATAMDGRLVAAMISVNLALDLSRLIAE